MAGVLEALLPSMCPSSEHLSGTPRGRSADPSRLLTAHSSQPNDQEASSSADANEDVQDQESRAMERTGSELRFHGKAVTILVAGIPVSLDASISWLHATLHHPDFFLYVVVHLQKG